MTTLKPCPFCGSEAGQFYSAIKNKYMTKCSNSECLIEVFAFTYQEWNTRPIEDKLQAELEIKNKQIEFLKKEPEQLKKVFALIKDSRITELQAELKQAKADLVNYGDNLHACNTKLDKQAEEIEKVKEIITRYGGIDGGHHKMWVIDQVIRILTGDTYDEWVTHYQAGEDGPETYLWDIGIAP